MSDVSAETAPCNHHQADRGSVRSSGLNIMLSVVVYFFELVFNLSHISWFAFALKLQVLQNPLQKVYH